MPSADCGQCFGEMFVELNVRGARWVRGSEKQGLVAGAKTAKLPKQRCAIVLVKRGKHSNPLKIQGFLPHPGMGPAASVLY
jgi:hypothetical protein